LLFDATSASYPQPQRSLYRRPRSTEEDLLRKTPRWSSLALQHTKIQAPFFSLRDPEASDPRCPANQKCHSQGLATLSVVSACLDPWKPLSAPHARGLRPSKLSSSSVILQSVSQLDSALALSSQTCPAWNRSSNGFVSPKKPCPLLLPQRFRSGRGRLLSWAFGPLGLLPPNMPTPESLSPKSPSRSFDLSTLRSINRGTPRALGILGLALSLRKGRRPVWPSLTDRLIPPLWTQTRNGLFFHLK